MDQFSSIQVDRDVFAFLQTHATPLIDTPNDVLRRLLLGTVARPRPEDALISPTTIAAPVSTEAFLVPSLAPPVPQSVAGAISAEAFVVSMIRQEFGTGFRRRPPYRMMYDSDEALVYFQNFNKESDHLWYRVTENAWRDLRSSRKAAWLCLSNPAEQFAYVIPMSAVLQRVERAGWKRSYLEINIDPATSRWTELDWRLEEFLKRAK